MEVVREPPGKGKDGRQDPQSAGYLTHNKALVFCFGAWHEHAAEETRNRRIMDARTREALVIGRKKALSCVLEFGMSMLQRRRGREILWRPTS